MLKKLLWCGLIYASLPIAAIAQFNIDGQYVLRAELRNGYGKLITEGADPAAFIGHRARLQASYTKSNFTFYLSIQDIRVWGNTPQTKTSDNLLSVHEAYVEGKLSEKWKIKLGRQELNYDNARFLGNLDWALQARAHDFALIKYESGNAKLHMGAGYNQDAQQLAGNTFTISNQYKVAQLVRFENTWKKFHLSALYWNDGRQYTVVDSSGRITDKGIRYRQTLGLPAIKYQSGNTSLSAFYYYQFGKMPQGLRLSAHDISAQIVQQFNLDTASKRKLRIGIGFEIISGTPAGQVGKSNSFSPLYGTNHMHNGYMDLFYVGGAHENNVGLEDFFVKGTMDFNAKLFAQIDGHLFYTHKDVLNMSISGPGKYLGTELDFTIGYLVNDAVSLQGGYSQLFKSDTFEAIQNNPDAKDFQNWAYIMFIFRPTHKNKFIGILF